MIQVGSKVICMDARNTTYLIARKEYEVKSIEYGGSHVCLVNSYGYEGKDSTYHISRFKEV